jgi:DNA-binding transcriptional MerR regulator
MEILDIIKKLKDIGTYHELALQECKELIEEVKKQAADSSAACKKIMRRKSRKQKSREFAESEVCKQIVARRNFQIQKGMKKE